MTVFVADDEAFKASAAALLSSSAAMVVMAAVVVGRGGGAAQIFAPAANLASEHTHARNCNIRLWWSSWWFERYSVRWICLKDHGESD